MHRNTKNSGWVVWTCRNTESTTWNQAPFGTRFRHVEDYHAINAWRYGGRNIQSTTCEHAPFGARALACGGLPRSLSLAFLTTDRHKKKQWMQVNLQKYWNYHMKSSAFRPKIQACGRSSCNKCVTVQRQEHILPHANTNHLVHEPWHAEDYHLHSFRRLPSRIHSLCVNRIKISN